MEEIGPDYIFAVFHARKNICCILICFVYAFVFGRFILDLFRVLKRTNHFPHFIRSDGEQYASHTDGREAKQQNRDIRYCFGSALGE